MLKIKSIKPIGSQILVSKDLYGWDDFDSSGLIIHKRGDLKTYQRVLAVGSDVKLVKQGDVVEINFYKYAVFKEDPNSVKAINDNPIVGLRLNEVELTNQDGDIVPCLLVDQRDVRYILEDFEECTYKKGEEIIIEQPKVNLILPSTSIK
jgi:co-chaperonin GroES (HSP10)